MRKLFSQLARCSLIAAAVVSSTASAGDLIDGDETGFKPFVEIAIKSDSNVYRVESDAALGLVDADQRDDISVDAAVGFEMATQSAAQRLELDARILRETYAEFSSLDHTGGDARMLWRWQPTDKWNGRIRASYEKLRRSFDNRLQLQEDIRQKARIGAESRFLHKGSWRSIVSADFIDTSFDEETNLDKQRVVVGLAAHKLGSRDSNHYGIEARAVDAAFDVIPEADYQQLEVSAVLDWQISNNNHVAVRLGWTRRDLEDNELRDDYSGVTGQIALRTEFNENLAVDTQVYRRLSNLSDDIADYTKMSGLRVTPELTLGARTVLALHAGYEKRDFSGNLTDRKDDVYDVGVTARWKVSGQSELSLSYHHLQKDSTLSEAEFDTDIIKLGIRFVL